MCNLCFLRNILNKIPGLAIGWNHSAVHPTLISLSTWKLIILVKLYDHILHKSLLYVCCIIELHNYKTQTNSCCCTSELRLGLWRFRPESKPSWLYRSWLLLTVRGSAIRAFEGSCTRRTQNCWPHMRDKILDVCTKVAERCQSVSPPRNYCIKS